MKISLNCEYCGKEIARYPCQIKAHNFCSRFEMQQKKMHRKEGGDGE